MRPEGYSGDASEEVTRLLIAWREGDLEAPRELFAVLYQELRALARAQLRRRQHDTLATTGLVHEAFVKLADQTRLDLRDHGHFLALAARAMRQILVDHARKRLADKRGGAVVMGALDESGVAGDDMNAAELLALDDALVRLETLDRRLAQVVEMRFFAGFSVKDTADALGVSERSVKRDWQKARAFLYAELHPEKGP